MYIRGTIKASIAKTQKSSSAPERLKFAFRKLFSKYWLIINMLVEMRTSSLMICKQKKGPAFLIVIHN